MEAVEFLIAHGLDFKVENIHGKTAEVIAREHGHPEVARLLKRMRIGDEVHGESFFY